MSKPLSVRRIATYSVGRVTAHEASADVNIRISDGNHYYINRGLENGIDFDRFQSEIMAKSITLHYADHWTPLDPSGKVRHVSRVTIGDKILYNEIIE